MRSDDLDYMLDLLPSPSYFFDLQSHRILAVNAAFQQIMGYTRDQLLSMTLEQLRPPEDLERLRLALASTPAEGIVEWKYVTGAGAPLYVLISYRNNLLLDDAGIPHGVRLVVISRWSSEPMPSPDKRLNSMTPYPTREP